MLFLFFPVVNAFAEPGRAIRIIDGDTFVFSTPENKAALDTKIAECKNNPGALWDTPNCKNARAALERRATSGTFQKVEEPPVPRFSSPPAQ